MSKLFSSVAVGGVLLLAGSTSAQVYSTEGGYAHGGSGPAFGRNVSVLRASQPPVTTLLRKRVAGVDWLERTFEEVLNWLRSESDDNVNVLPRWNSLNAEGVDKESLITLKLVDVTIAEVLSEALRQLSDDRRVAYRGRDNMLWISSKDDLGRDLPVKVYNVTDILFEVPDMGRSAPIIDLDKASQSGGSGGGGQGQSVFTGSAGQAEELEQEESEVEERLEEIRDMIIAIIEPTSWGPAGLGSIEIFNNRALVVRNTIEVHEMIGGFFKHE